MSKQEIIVPVNKLEDPIPDYWLHPDRGNPLFSRGWLSVFLQVGYELQDGVVVDAKYATSDQIGITGHHERAARATRAAGVSSSSALFYQILIEMSTNYGRNAPRISLVHMQTGINSEGDARYNFGYFTGDIPR